MKTTALFILIVFLSVPELTYASDPPAAAVRSDSTIPFSTLIQDARFDTVREKMIHMVKNGQVPSFTIAVAKNGKIIWEESFGWADREKGIPATPESMYSIASTTKPMTATGLMMLKERGLVNLSEPVNTYIAPAKLTAHESDDSSATVKHLLNHTAGMPMHYTYLYEDQSYRKPDMAESIRRYGILVHPPGEYFEYSNFGYGILHYIIEQVSGQSYPEYMKKEVFVPLGMTHSSVNIDPDLAKYAVTRYDEDNQPIPFYAFNHDGASAVFSSAPDLVRFGMFHMKNPLPDQVQILNDASIDEMQTEKEKGVVSWDEETETGYALGWTIGKYRGYKTVSHNGGMPGVATSFMMVPSENVVIVVLTNCLSFPSYGLPYEIANQLLPEKKSEEKEPEEKEHEEKEQLYSVSDSVLLGTWEGTLTSYECENPISMEFQEDGDVLVEYNREGPNDFMNLATLLNNFEFTDGTMKGQFYGTIETSDARRYPHNIYVSMKLKGDRLVGYAGAYATTKRVQGMLPSYITLTKK
jgi:CubicO group peptidase (beta-lactamase class C family)